MTAQPDGADSVDRLLLNFAKELRFIDSQRLNLLISKQEEARLRTVAHQNTKAAIHQYISDGIDAAYQMGITDLELYERNHDGEEMDVVDRQRIRNNLGLKKGD